MPCYYFNRSINNAPFRKIDMAYILLEIINVRNEKYNSSYANAPAISAPIAIGLLFKR